MLAVHERTQCVLNCNQHTNDFDYSESDRTKMYFRISAFESTKLHCIYFPTAVTTCARNNGWWQKIFRVTQDDNLHHVVSEVFLESAVLFGITLVCVKEESKQFTIYLRSKPEDGGRFCYLLLIIIILMNTLCKNP